MDVECRRSDKFIKVGKNYYAVNDHFGFSKSGTASRRQKFTKTASESNLFILDTLAELFNFSNPADTLKKENKPLTELSQKQKRSMLSTAGK